MYSNLNSRLLSYRQLVYRGRVTDLSVVGMPKKVRPPRKRKSRRKKQGHVAKRKSRYSIPNRKKGAKRPNEHSPWKDFVFTEDNFVINLHDQRTINTP